jgi:glycosyltransferase involved in cell wall biosynthesis
MSGVTASTDIPLISVVVCTFHRADLLRRALGALCGQTISPSLFEVVVVDDGSTDDTRKVVDTFGSLLTLRYAYQSNSGIASAKNHGLFLSRGPLVLFLDDDDVADSRLLEEHYRSHQKFPQEKFAVLGFTDLAPMVARSPLMHYVTEVGCQLFSYPRLRHDDHLDFSYFWGGRSSCKKSFLLEHGVFNPVFRFGAEDIELGYRLSKVGLTVIYNEQAISHMVRVLDLDAFVRRCYLQGRSNWIFSQLHPDETVRSWTLVEGVSESWKELQPRFELLMKMCRNLDRLASIRTAADLPLDNLTRQLLHAAYDGLFTAARIQGTATMQLADHAGTKD